MVTISEQDRLIETILDSINVQYENLERIDKELEKVREEKDTIFKSNN